MLTSQSIDKIAAALAKAQGEMKVPSKSKTANIPGKEGRQGYSYKYGDLADVREAITPALTANGLALSQLIDADKQRLVTMLLHESGQFLASSYDLPKGLSAQQFGSTLTYARRYSLCALLGVVADEDDDAHMGQEASKRQGRNERRAASTGKSAGPDTNGTSRPPLPRVPQGLTREAIDQKLRDAYAVLVKLNPQLDLAAEMMARYGVEARARLSGEELWDFYNWMTVQINKGMEVPSEPAN